MRLTAILTTVVAGAAGLVGAGVAHDHVRQPAPRAPEPIDRPVVVVSYKPCKRPAVLVNGTCVRTDTIYRLPRMTPPPAQPTTIVVVPRATPPGQHKDD